MNKKGFSLVEVLVAITILGVLGVIAVAATAKYLSSSRNKAYVTASQSVYEAAENCTMDGNCNTDTILISTLVEKGYIKSIKNPKEKNENCNGAVWRSSNNSTGDKLKSYRYGVQLICKGITVKGKEGSWENMIVWPVEMGDYGISSYNIEHDIGKNQISVEDIIKTYRISS